LFLNTAELTELRRLLCDFRNPPKEITSDKKLLKLFIDQFKVRMNNSKRYSTKQILTALEAPESEI